MNGEGTHDLLPPADVQAALPSLTRWRWLASGGFSTVFAADDEVHGRPVAVKVMTGVGAQWSSREAFAAGGLASHPNVVTVYDSGVTPTGVGWIEMEYLPGGSLLDTLAQGPMEPERVAEVVADLATALDATHDRGMVHSDVKPGNAFINEYGTALLGDFGVARMLLADDQSTLDRDVGPFSRAYAAPEVLLGHPPTAGTDVWMLAATACHLLTGQPPFKGEQITGAAFGIDRTIGALESGAGDRSRSSVDGAALAPRRLRPVLTRAFADEPGDRYATCTDLAVALARAVRNGSGADDDPPGSAPVAMPRRRHRRRVLVVGAAVVAVLAVAAALAMAGGRGHDDPKPPGALSTKPLTVGDLRATWVPAGGGALQVDPLAGARRTAFFDGDWLGQTWDRTQFWSIDDEVITRHDAADGEKLGTVELPAQPELPDAELAGWAWFPNETRTVVLAGEAGFARHVVSDDGDVVATATYVYEGLGAPQLADWAEAADGGVMVVQPTPGEGEAEAPEGSAELVHLGSDGKVTTKEVACTGLHSLWTDGNIAADSCDSLVTTYQLPSLERIGEVELPELGDGYDMWAFAATDLQEHAGRVEPERALLWSGSGFVQADLTALEVTARTPRTAVWRAAKLGDKPSIEKVWSTPASVDDLGAVVMSREGSGGPYQNGQVTVAALAPDLGDPRPSAAPLPASARDVTVESHDGRVVLVASGEWCCTPANIETDFVDPFATAVVARSNPGVDVTMEPAADGAWMLDLPGRVLVHIDSSSGRRRTITLDLPDDVGADGSLPQLGTIELVGADDVVIRYWDEGAWHLVQVDLDDNSTTEIAQASGEVEVQAVGPSDPRSVWVFTASGERYGTDGDEPFVAALRRLDLATGSEGKEVAVAEPGFVSFWAVLPDGGVAVVDGFSLRRLAPTGDVADEVDLSQLTVDVDGEQGQVMGSDYVVDQPSVAVWDDQLWMVPRPLDSGAPAIVAMDLDTLAPAGPATKLRELGPLSGDPVLWPLADGLLVGYKGGPMGVFDGEELTLLTESNFGYRLHPGAATVGYDSWNWVKGPTVDPSDPIESGCPTWIDHVVKDGGDEATLWLCPGNRTIGVVPTGADEPVAALDY